VGIGTAEDLSGEVTDFFLDGGSHGHGISGKTTSTLEDKAPTHTHNLQVTLKPTGSAGPWLVRGGQQLDFLSNLRISIGKAGSTPLDITNAVLDYVKRNYASVWSNETSFDGHTGSPLHDHGTGPIRLDLIDGLSFDPDDFTPYEITLWVQTADNGGSVKYNLYVD
jgi:hypothetical protein